MTNEQKFVLPGGIWIDGIRHQNVELDALCGKAQEYLLSLKKHHSAAHWTTEVLTQCIRRLGPLNSIDSDVVRSLTVGDREALLLQIRRLTLGGRLDCIVHCPMDTCDETMTLDLTIADLLLPPYENANAIYEITLGRETATYHVKFRLPTGRDQEFAAIKALNDRQQAVQQLLQACIVQITTDDNIPIENIPNSVREELPRVMADLDPQSELVLNLTCTGCGISFSTILDVGTYLSGELENNLNQLYKEVHFLAYHYHWAEKEIMSMSTRKRHRYCNLLLNSI